MRRLLVAMTVAEVVLLVVAVVAGLAASGGMGRAYGTHRACGLAMAALAMAVPVAGLLEARSTGRRVRNAWGGVAPDWAEAQLERLRRRMMPLAAGSIAMSAGTVTLGWLAESREWSPEWHLGVAMALTSYTIGGAWLVVGNIVAESRLERMSGGEAAST